MAETIRKLSSEIRTKQNYANAEQTDNTTESLLIQQWADIIYVLHMNSGILVLAMNQLVLFKADHFCTQNFHSKRSHGH